MDISNLVIILSINKSIANDCVIPHHCKHFHLPIFSNRFIFSVSPLNKAAKSWNEIFVMIFHNSDQLLQVSDKSLSTQIIFNFSEIIHVCCNGQGQIIPFWSNTDQHNHIINCKFQKNLFNL